MDAFIETTPHRPLSTTDPSEIRVVALHPGEWDDPIVCTLTHVSLDDDPPYNTVSYVWGDPTPIYEINLDGVVYPVAANLFQVLHRLRDYNRWHPGDDECPKPLVLWIDALCINQTDKPERASQVGMMTRIYTKATKVFACVGEIEPYKEDTVEKLFSIPWEPLKRDEYREAHAEEDAEDDDESVPSSTGPTNWFTWKELAERVEGDPVSLKQCIVGLCGEEFFSRIWIVQELTLGHYLEAIILYGPHSINLTFLLELLMALRYDHVHSNPDFLEICKVTANAFAMLSGAYQYHGLSEMTTAELTQHLLELIRSTQHFHATEPRDRIYALLGLVNKELLPADLLPSYNTPINKIYQPWTKFLLENTGDLSIIDNSFVEEENIPTWVSSLSLGTDQKTTPGNPSNVRFSNDGQILHVKGRLINFVLGSYSPPTSSIQPSQSASGVSTNEPSNPNPNQNLLLTQIQEMEKSLVQHVRADKDHGTSYIPYLFDLMLRQSDTNKRFSASQYDEYLMKAVTQLYEQILSPDINADDDTRTTTTNTEEVLLALTKILNGHDWVVLANGSVFRVDARRTLIKPPDEAYLLEGSSGLTILRRQGDTETFSRIGYCDAGVDHEEWSGLEGTVNDNFEGKGPFRPRVGLVEIAIS